MSCKISRRSFLKVSGCLMLGSAVSGLLCGAGDPAEGGAAVPTVGGLRVNYVRAFAKDYGNNFRQMEIHLNIENTNSSAAYFNQENFVPMLGNSRYGGEFTFTGLNKQICAGRPAESRGDPDHLLQLQAAAGGSERRSADR